MSTYYQYKDVMVMIAHKLMKLEGWKVYGYKPDESDSMTDYYSPAHWGGIAEKNGYILVVNNDRTTEATEIKQYTNTNAVDRSIHEKITKLQALTTERGATEGEEANAQKMIEKLQTKLEAQEEQSKQYIVSGIIPEHMANPPRCNWHIEKDGVIIAKGNGILKYAEVEKYYHYAHYAEDIQKFKEDKEQYIKDLTEYYILHNYYAAETAPDRAKYQAEEMEKNVKLVDQFESFINKIDTTCGGLIGADDGFRYEKVKIIKYKTEVKPIETQSGSIKEGQCFILKLDFNYGCRKGLVYRIHETEYNGVKHYHAYKLNGKYTKECTGHASSNNRWYTFGDKFNNWIEKGVIAWCELQEVKTSYEVEKVVKKKITEKTSSTDTENTTEAGEGTTKKYTYQVAEDVDTRDNSKIFVVKVLEKLSKSEYIKVNQYMKSLGAYYSKFKHGFIFKENPTEILNGNIKMPEYQAEEPPETTQKLKINYTITEDKHTKTGQTIYCVTPDETLSKAEFTEIKQKFATLKGFYSSFKKAFIFDYNPKEALKEIINIA